MGEEYFVNKTSDAQELSGIMKSTVGVELHVEDFSTVREFYASLGFEIIFDSPGNYLTLRMGKVVLSFWGDGGRFFKHPYFTRWPPNTKKGFAVEIIVPVPGDITEYFEGIKHKVKVVDELKLKRWGAKDFRIEDPNGFYLRFTEPHDWVFDFEGYTPEETDR